MTERECFVLRTASDIVSRYYLRVPRDLLSLCTCLGIKKLPLSTWVENGNTEEEFFRLMRNEDGAAASFDGVGVCILYNDRQPHHRVRFTLAEEIMHILLGHVFDSSFRTSSQFDEALYEQYEHEAKLGASLLLMPPPLYYRYRRLFKLRKLAAIFDMSEAATFRTMKYYEENESIVRSNFSAYCPWCDVSRYIAYTRDSLISVWDTGEYSLL